MNAVTSLNRPRPVKLTVDEFELLCDAGVFEHNSRTELIEGEIFAVNALYRPHSYAHSRLFMRLAEALNQLGIGLEPLIAPSVRMAPDSMPEPDIVITSEPIGPRAVPLASVRLAIEISDATLRFDLVRRQRLYARNAIPEYWVFDVKKRQIHQFWTPIEDAYSDRKSFAFGEPISSICVAGLTIATDKLA